MEKSLQSDCCANKPAATPSFQIVGCTLHADRSRRTSLKSLLSALCLAMFVAGCGTTPSASEPAAKTETKPAVPAIPDDIQATAKSMLGGETQVLLFGDLAKTGKQQFLAANVVPKSTKNQDPGTIVTRTVVAENNDGKWSEILRCDEHLKNQKGYLGLTPLEPVSGWRIQYEQDAEKGLNLYFTPMQPNGDKHVLPIGVRWNTATKRYQSLDRAYEHFLLESPSLDTARSVLR